MVDPVVLLILKSDIVDISPKEISKMIKKDKKLKINIKKKILILFNLITLKNYLNIQLILKE